MNLVYLGLLLFYYRENKTQSVSIIKVVSIIRIQFWYAGSTSDTVSMIHNCEPMIMWCWKKVWSSRVLKYFCREYIIIFVTVEFIISGLYLFVNIQNKMIIHHGNRIWRMKKSCTHTLAENVLDKIKYKRKNAVYFN